jgi:glycosyltransferase involved in cell wall biosynthesis
MPLISAVVLTKNNASTIKTLLDSLSILPEVVLLDNGSTDETLEIGSSFSNVKIEKSPFTSFGELRNLGASFATHDWILAIDADESLPLETQNFIISAHLDSKKIYTFPFRNFFQGKLIKGCGWHPDYHPRLYDKRKAQFSLDKVHEKLISKSCSEEKLSCPIHHVSYQSVSDFLRKMQTYSDLFALTHCDTKKSSLSKAIGHGLYTFFKSYFLQKGVLDGREGFIISLYQSQTAYYKYLKLAEMKKKP